MHIAPTMKFAALNSEKKKKSEDIYKKKISLEVQGTGFQKEFSTSEWRWYSYMTGKTKWKPVGIIFFFFLKNNSDVWLKQPCSDPMVQNQTLCRSPCVSC